MSTLSILFKKFLALILIVQFLSCDNFKFNDYQILPDKGYHNINSNNIEKFIHTTTDTITIAVIGDSQRFYEGTSKVVSKINTIPNVNFVVHTGDIVDFGIQKEYLWMADLFSKLNYPYVAVVGNHDLIGNGGELYRQMYGEYNFSFTFNRNKFIYLNTNSREFNFSNNVPDISWLDNELSDTANYTNAIVISHVPHNDPDFNSALNSDYMRTLHKYKKVLLSINGHTHAFGFIAPRHENAISYLTSYSTSGETFILVKIWETSFSYEIIH